MSEQVVYFLREDVSLRSIFEGVAREGFQVVRRAPRRGDAAPFFSVDMGEGRYMLLVDSALLGVRLIDWKSGKPMPAWLESSVVRRTADELAARARDAKTPEEKIATLCEAVVALAPNLPDGIRAVLAARLRDSEEAVRWMAHKSVVTLSDASLEQTLGEMLAGGPVPEDMEPWARELHELAVRAVRGDYIDDLATDNEDYLRDAVRRDLTEKKWRRVEVAAARLLWKEMPLYELEAAAAWAKAMAATGRVWKAYFAALLVSEIERSRGQEGLAAVVRAEIEPTLAAREDLPAREDLHPVLWIIRDRLNDDYTAACDRALDAMDAHVKNLEAERLLFRAISLRNGPEGRPLAKKLRELLPGAITPLALLAYLHGSDDTGDEALADAEALAAAMAQRELAAEGKAEPPPPEIASFDTWAEGILAYQARRPKDLIREHIRILQKRGDYEGALRAAERAIAAKDTALAWMDKGFILTSMKRHADAIAAYTEAIARVDKDGQVLLGGSYDVLWFNRACERAISGEHEGALRDLAIAVEKDEKWIEKAREDDYFDSIREDPRFEGILTKTYELPPESSPFDWKTLADRAKGLSFLGRYEEAIAAGREALRKAEKALPPEDPGIATCLENLGFAATWGGDPQQGATALRRAVAIRERIDADSREAGEAYHHLGSALGMTGDGAGAELYYGKALALREKHDGVESAMAAKSWGDMSGLSLGAGRRDEGIERLRRARSILEKVIAGFQAEGRAADDDSLVEARADLLTVCGNLLLTHARGGEYEPAIEAARGAVAEAAHLGTRINPNLRSSIAQTLQALAEQGAPGALETLAALADAVLPKEPPEVIESRVRWSRIRAGLEALRDAGFGDDFILARLKDALRGEPPPPAVARVAGATEALSGFVQEIATTQGTNIVVTIMALQTAEAGGRTLDETLHDLQELAIASVGASVENKGSQKEQGKPSPAKSDEPPPWERDPFGNPYLDSEMNRRLGYGDEDDDSGYDDSEYDNSGEDDEGESDEDGYDDEDEGDDEDD
ncbi:tetratricopeptide repeat protein [Polyangium sp. y55x31]|uniref:tetratricopeptide repeat protein n=1 Tax=Polyangium sp. y55x31 TaxID=3042688 RepID=UPI002482C6CF|nr:tetratricopeptide repeat protein [Polyangium sp. y55x31]MDI1482533.1 tetratricopeptide repeat protein [Polyangium sp. y55x31]